MNQSRTSANVYTSSTGTYPANDSGAVMKAVVIETAISDANRQLATAGGVTLIAMVE